MIAPRNARIEEDAVQCRRLEQLDVAFLPQLARKRLGQRLAGFDPAARQMPAGNVAVLHEEYPSIRVYHEPAYAEREPAGEAPIKMECTTKWRGDDTSHGSHRRSRSHSSVKHALFAVFAQGLRSSHACIVARGFGSPTPAGYLVPAFRSSYGIGARQARTSESKGH